MTKVYEKYKNIDGYGYVDSIPLDWELLPNIAIFDERISKGHLNEELISVTIGRGIIKQSDIGNKKDNSNEDKSNYKLVEVGDIAYNKMRMWQGSVGYSQYRGIVSPAYVVLKPKREINPKYYHYLFRTKYYNNYVKRFSYGLCDDQLNLRYSDFKKMYSIVPPLDVQNKIVNYLDKKIDQVNRFIIKKRKLIESLNEYKKNIINEAVTKGINPYIEYKDSNLEWIDKIPAHWDTIKIKHLISKMEYGLSLSGEKEGDYKYLNMGNIQDGRVKLEGCSYLDNINKDILLNKNDLIFNRTNSLALVGKVGIFKGKIEDKVTFASYLVRFKLKKIMNPDFLNFYLNSDKFISYARSNAFLSLNQANLNPNRYSNIKIAIPSYKEQGQIANYIELNIKQIEKAILGIEKEIELIQEYIDSMVYYTLIGKIKYK